jgi:phage baseplate assembly protein W
MAKQAQYSGISFPMRKGGHKGFFSIATDEQLIKESIHVILNTRKGEMPMNAGFGSVIHEYLFELLTPADLNLLCSKIKAELELWEPRISIISIDASAYEETRYFDILAEIKSTKARISTTASFTSVK